MPKVVFLQPRSFHTWEALNIGYLASYLKAHEYSNIGFFSEYFDKKKEIVEGCRDADIIGISCTSPQYRGALSLAKLIKKRRNLIVLGGVHASAVPTSVLESGAVDIVVVGEGERAMLEIVEGNRKNIIKCSYVSSLDSIPFPDRQVINQERNIQQAYRENGKRIASILASRGCPFCCTFCASSSVWSRRVRYRTAQNILEEFAKLVKDMSIDFVKFCDDTFTLRRDIVTEFCEQKIRLGIKTPWGCNARADSVDKSVLKLMHSAGCEELWIGVESGAKAILRDMNKAIDIEDVKRVFRESKNIGFVRRAYVLLGMPNEDYSDIAQTEDLIDEIQPDMVGFTILAPYPGTAHYNSDLHKDVDWSVVDEYSNNITSSRYLSNSELKAEQLRLIDKYKKKLVYRQKNHG